MTIGINTSALISYYQAKAGIPASSTSSSGTTSSSTAPAPPWNTSPTPAQTSAQVQAALSGGSIIKPQTSQLSGGGNANYNNLFALYQGLTTLQNLATQAAAPGQSTGQIDQLQSAFSRGLSQVQSFLATNPFNGFKVVQGKDTTQQQAGLGVASETDNYTTGTIYSGAPNTAVPALQGDLSFTATVTGLYGAPKTVNFNLDDLGTTTRSVGNVANYLNAQLKAAGVASTFSVVHTPGAPQTISLASGQKVTLPAGPDQYALKLNGNSLETVAFSAPTQTPAIYVAQTAGVAAAKSTASTTSAATSTTSTGSSTNSTSSTTSGPVQQLLKLDPSASNPRVFTDALGKTVTNVTATATSPDGSVYVLGDINGPTSAGETSASQTIIGSQDVALFKYDSAGNLLTTSVLGAASSASGLALAVSADGSQVAVAGTVTGALSGTTAPADPTVPSSFVSVYDSKGDPVWTARQNASAGDQVNSVAFGANGAVYVGGTTQSTLNGAPLTGQTSAYLTGYTSKGVRQFTSQFGATGQNKVTGVAVDGASIVTAGVENGDAVVRSFAIPASGAPTLTATRDLGAVQGGSVAGVAVNADGSVVVAGSTHNGALDAGTVTTAYTSGQEAFIARLSADLTPSASDTLTYYKGAGDTTASALTIAGGQVYLAGQVSVAPSTGQTTAYDGYVAQIDPASGAVNWSNLITSGNNESAPVGIAVDPTGSSVLDALGLPTGTINKVPNQTLVADGAVAAGDQFTVTAFGVARTVTITAADTLDTLATKIQQASSYQATTTVVTTNGVRQLQIKPSNSQSLITLGDGPTGQDALPGLGLTAGLIAATTTIQSKTSTVKTSYGLSLPSTLNLNSTASIAAAKTALTSASGTIAGIYLDLTTPPKSKTSGNTSLTGTVPAYLQAEIANYQAGLDRLTGGSTSASTSLASLFGA